MKRSHIPSAMRLAVYRRDRHRCVYCGRHETELREPGYAPGPDRMYRLTIEHLIPHCFGGPNAEWNLATACFGCNIGRQENQRAEAIALLAERLLGVVAA